MALMFTCVGSHRVCFGFHMSSQNNDGLNNPTEMYKRMF